MLSQGAAQRTGRTYLYRWDVHLDDRTSDECRAIWEEQLELWDEKGREGLTMDELQELCGRHSRTGDPFWPHHNCRSSLVRAVHAEFPDFPPLLDDRGE